MARLASEAKMGFYATSTKTIKKILDTCISFKENTFTLDSCAGKGEVIEMFREEYGHFNYAVELNEDRAKEAARRNIMRVLNADAIAGVRKSTNWVGLNFLNPPYDRAADGSRLECKFVERYGNATVQGGLMMLVINPSSADAEMAQKLIVQGYKPLWSIYDSNNEDYKNFGQFFILLQRVRENFRCSMDKFLTAFDSPISIDELEVSKKFSPRPGVPPQMFKEISIPYWKMQELLTRSKLKDRFFEEMKKANFEGGSIEIPNEGQAAILIASGKLNKQITLRNGHRVILKGTVKKHTVDKPRVNDEGVIDKVAQIDAYQTVVYGLNLTVGQFVKYE